MQVKLKPPFLVVRHADDGRDYVYKRIGRVDVEYACPDDPLIGTIIGYSGPLVHTPTGTSEGQPHENKG
jgi:hypothetical protein